jgi:nitrogen fixation NifU-like protein
MSELRELYQEVIIDHGRHPRNFGILPQASHSKEGFNPLCGDHLFLYINEQDGVLKELSFKGCGCAISMASASLMTEVLKGKSITVAEEFFAAFHEMITVGELTQQTKEKLGKLAVLSGVCEFPARVKCATLAWHTLKAALAHDIAPVSTEEEGKE